MFVLPFVFLDPLYVLVVLALVLCFGYLAQSLVNLRRIWFILLMIPSMTVILWSIFGSGRDAAVPLRGAGGVALRVQRRAAHRHHVVAGMIFLSTTRNEEVAIGLVRLGIPYRFAFAVSTALRLVPTIVATGLTIGQAQRSRGLDLDSGNLIQRIRKAPPLLVPVFVTTVRSTNVFSHGAGVQRASGPAPGAHTFSTSPWDAQGRAGSGIVRGAPGRVHRVAVRRVRWTGGVHQYQQ